MTKIPKSFGGLLFAANLPQLKKELFAVEMAFVSDAKDSYLGAFSDCPVHPCFEGHRHSILRATGDEEVQDFVKIEGTVAIKIGDNLDTVFARLVEMAAEMAGKIREHTFKTLDESLSALGRTIDGKDKPWTEQFLEMLSKVQFPLNDEGEIDIDGFRIVAGAEIQRQMMKELKELNENPTKLKEFLERQSQILAEKEKEARALEANRKLVG